MVYKTKMYLFGGSSTESENVEIYALDLESNKWSLVKVKPEDDD